MTVNQLIERLQQMPAHAVVIFESDTGYDGIGDLLLQENNGSLPDEVILLPAIGD
jgi:hypothetical protein